MTLEQSEIEHLRRSYRNVIRPEFGISIGFHHPQSFQNISCWQGGGIARIGQHAQTTIFSDGARGPTCTSLICEPLIRGKVGSVLSIKQRHQHIHIQQRSHSLNAFLLADPLHQFHTGQGSWTPGEGLNAISFLQSRERSFLILFPLQMLQQMLDPAQLIRL